MMMYHSTTILLLALLTVSVSLEAFVLNNKTNTLHRSSASLENNDYDCLRFDDSDREQAPGDMKKWLYGSKTTYLQAREDIRKVYNASWPFDPESCEPVYLYTMARHSVRYPTSKEANQAKTQLPDIARRLIAGGKLKHSTNVELSKWKALYHQHQDSHLTDSGIYHSAVTAGIFLKHFPQLLNISTNNFEVGISKKPRTNETANAFIRALVEMQLDGSNLTYDKAKLKVDEVIKEKFSVQEKELLSVHEQCKKTKNAPPHPPVEYYELMDTETYRNLTVQFAKRNGLSTPLPIKTLIFIQNICSYEQAFYGHSVWCELFTNQEWKALSYLEQYKAYIEAYGYELYRKMACVAIVDLHSRLKTIVTNGGQSNSNTFLYGHSTFIKRFFSFLRLFNQFPPHQVDEFNRVCLPKQYQWVTGLVSPLGTNLAVSLYRCNHQYKLFTLFNEVPMGIRGCPSGFCDVQQFLDEFNDLAENCNVDEMCPLEKEAVWLKMF